MQPGLPTPRKWWRWLKYGALGVICTLALVVLGMRLTGVRLGIDAQRLIGAPACMPSLLYTWSRTSGGPYTKGEYIVALMPETPFHVGGRPGDRIIKIVMGVPGDTIRIQGTELWINGEHTDRLWLAKSLPGKTVGDYDTEMVLPPGQYFVMGTTHESFDSRYWGPLHREAIIGTARPLL